MFYKNAKATHKNTNPQTCGFGWKWRVCTLGSFTHTLFAGAFDTSYREGGFFHGQRWQILCRKYHQLAMWTTVALLAVPLASLPWMRYEGNVALVTCGLLFIF